MAKQFQSVGLRHRHDLQQILNIMHKVPISDNEMKSQLIRHHMAEYRPYKEIIYDLAPSRDSIQYCSLGGFTGSFAPIEAIKLNVQYDLSLPYQFSRLYWNTHQLHVTAFTFSMVHAGAIIY